LNRTRAVIASQIVQHKLALEIDFEILFGGEAIPFGRTVLRHQDYWSLHGRRH
jgi:hypothetical protein